MQYFVGSEIKEDDFTVIEVVTPNVDDVYDDIDVYGERQAQLEGYVTLSAETVAENVEKNQGVVVLKKAVRNAVAQSPTVVNYANGLSEAENIALMAAIGGFEFKKPKVSINISDTMLEFEIELGGEIQVKNFKIGVEVTIANTTQVDYRYTICKSGKVTLNPLLWFYTDIKVDLSNDFSISLAATVEFSDAAEKAYGIIDITDEVEYVMDIAKDGQNKFAEAIGKSPFWDESDLEYADIFSIPLGQIPLPVPVVSLMLEFNVVGSLGARAGLYVEFAHHYVESTSLSNGSSPKGENGKPVVFDEFKFTRATLANEIDLSLTLKGQVGFRCGLEAKLSVSFAHLNKVAAVYVSFRFGPYIELSGLVSFHYNYDAVNKVSKTQLYGGMYLEVGLFVNAKLGARFLVYDINTDIFDKKIPLYGVGDRLIPLGFTEASNTPENPYVLTSRSSGVRMSTVQMRYLDIVTGEEVVDNALRNRYGAYQHYSFEFYDAPDYQTKDYDKYVTISNQATLINRSYPYKTLRFAVKAILQQKQGVYANGIERIFYVEFRNPDGRDYATQYSEFINEYYVGGGATHSEVLERVAFMEGEQVTPPDYAIETLPVRQGYYLDINDLWEKYYPFMGGQVDEEFDGTFPVVTYENATVIYKGYLIVNTCYYRLKWKQRTYTANIYYPEYSSAGVVSQNKALKSAEMIYVPYLRAFIVKTDNITAPDIYGKKYDSFVSSSGLIFTRDYYNVSPGDDAFTGWGVDENSYSIGSEKDADGKVKTYLTFKAQFAESYKYHIATFEAMDGAFGDGEKTRKLSGRYGDDLSYVRIDGYTDEKGTFTFVCWTTVPYSFEHRVEEKDMKFGNGDITYYAYYMLDPATITLTFKGKVKTEESDGTGNVYFYGDKTKTELTVSDLYGRGYYLTANVFAVDSKSKTFVPDYLRWVVDGEEYTSMFYNDGYMAYVPFDNNAVIEIVFKPATDKIINICFLSDGECYTLGGEKIDDVICKGYMSGFRHVANYYQTYGTTMTVPNVDYYSEYNYRFDHWEATAASNGAVVSVMPYDEITFTEDIVFQGVYVRDDNVKIQLTFRSEPKSEDPSETGDNLTGLRVFADGSVEIKNYGTFGENIAFDKVPTCSGMKFIGWTDGNVTVTAAELAQMTYSVKTTYYAVFEPETDADGFEITLNAGDGSFSGGVNEIKVENVVYGKLTAKLDKPVPNALNLVFSHYEDENGYPVTAVEKSQTLYAKYAIPVSDYAGLKNVNLAPDRNYVLTNDIKAGGDIWLDEGVTDWVALGADSVNGFSGVFNGNGYKLAINSNGRAARNFGLFSKISGTVYNLSVVGGYTLSGSTDASSVGAFTSEVTASGKIVDCQTFIRFEIHATSTQKMNISGAIGVNNGLIDGLMSSTSGNITVDGNKELIIGATVGTNNGTMKNVNQTGRIGYVYVNLSVNLDCNIGSFAGHNAGVIENSFSERSVIVNFSQGNNVYRKNSVMVGGFVGKNEGTVKNATAATEKAAFTVRNLTILDKEGLELDYNSYSGYPCYIISEVTPGEQGSPVYETLCVIYLDENAVKTGSGEYKEYTLSEFEKAHAKDCKKILSLKEAFTFGDFVSADSGVTDNCTYIQEVGTGNGTELVASCGFSGIKWNYLTRLHNKVYN